MSAACEVELAARPLPIDVRETSGLARGRRDPAVFWTHNDAGSGPELFAFDAAGAPLGRAAVIGANARDWEDIAAGECGAGPCLMVGDIGDNGQSRESITVYRVAEPEPGSPASLVGSPLHARFPDGPRDAEALFWLPDAGLFLVTKGEGAPVEIFRFPDAADPRAVGDLVRVRLLLDRPGDPQDRVTAASASPDGRWVAIRTYRALLVYPSADLVGDAPATPLVYDLRALGHPRGEAVAMGDDGRVWLTSEAGSREGIPLWSILRCSLPDR